MKVSKELRTYLVSKKKKEIHISDEKEGGRSYHLREPKVQPNRLWFMPIAILQDHLTDQ